MKKIEGYILLTRPPNLLITFLSIFLGGFVTGTIQPIVKLVLACFSGMLIAGGANSINDYFDLDIDRINKPKRPLPSGIVSSKQAYVFSVMLFGAGIVVSSFIHITGFSIAVISSIILYLYSFCLKRTVLWGNIAVALISGMAFLYGGLAVYRVFHAMVVGIFAFLYHLAREIIKDVEDVEGDRSQNLKTLPIQYGIKVSLVWITGILIFLSGVTLIPYILGLFSILYIIVVIFGVDLFLVYVIISMWKQPESENMGRLAVLMKADMVVGLLAIFLGR